MMDNFNTKVFSNRMEDMQIGFYKPVEEETRVIEVSSDKYKVYEHLENCGLSVKIAYECLGNGFVRKTMTKISTPDVDDMMEKLTAQPTVTGTYYVYGQKSGHFDVACAEVFVKKYSVSRFNYFVDDAGSTGKMDELLRIVHKGDAIVVGTITDFTCDGSVISMLNVLERLDSRGVIVLSRLEPDYDLSTYRPVIDLAGRIAGVIADGKTM